MGVEPKKHSASPEEVVEKTLGEKLLEAFQNYHIEEPEISNLAQGEISNYTESKLFKKFSEDFINDPDILQEVQPRRFYQWICVNTIPKKSNQNFLNIYIEKSRKIKKEFDEEKVRKDNNTDLKKDKFNIDSVYFERKILEANKPQFSSEKIKRIEGTTIIDQEFYLQTKSGEVFSKTKFYTAKQHKYTQWYGVIHDYDVRRKETDILKKIIITSFENYQYNKVSAIVYGSGGCGKSTLLRRIAIECRNEDFTILWVNEGEIFFFLEKGFPKAQQDNKNNYFIVIEDWYDFTNINPSGAISFLEQTRSTDNVRLIIGDRTIVEKKYLLYLNGNQTFFLGNSENKDLINEILGKIPSWKETAELTLNSHSYNTSLFSLLFIIARLYDTETSFNNIDFSDTKSAFLEIIYNDIKQVREKYLGFAKMLFYTSSIYKKTKTPISFSCFLKLADYFDPDSNISSMFKNINTGKGSIYNLIRTYCYTEKIEQKDDKSGYSVLQFNHDVLSKDGISEMGNLLGFEFDDTVKLEILAQILKLKEEHRSVSILLAYFIFYEKQIFNSNREILDAVDRLTDEGNLNLFHLNALASLRMEGKEFIKILRKVAEQGVYPHLLWQSAIESNPKMFASLILEDKFPNKIPSVILGSAIYAEGGEVLEKDKNRFFLNNWKKSSPNRIFIYESLFYYVDKPTIPVFIVDTIQSILTKYNDLSKFNKEEYFHYAQLLRIPFHSVDIWKKETQSILSNWRKKGYTTVVTFVLISYATYPSEILNTCQEILLQWRNEINKPIYHLGDIPFSRRKEKKIGYTSCGDHVEIALGHPSLRNLSKNIALEIRQSCESKEVKIPNTFELIVKNIIDHDIFPKWEDNLKQELRNP